MLFTEKEKEELEKNFGIKIDNKSLSDSEKDEKKKRIENIFNQLCNDEEYDKKTKKLQELKEKYKEKFGEEIEYYLIDFEEYNIDNEIKLVEKALKDNKPFVTIDAGIYEITLGGKKYKFWY